MGYDWERRKMDITTIFATLVAIESINSHNNKHDYSTLNEAVEDHSSQTMMRRVRATTVLEAPIQQTP